MKVPPTSHLVGLTGRLLVHLHILPTDWDQDFHPPDKESVSRRLEQRMRGFVQCCLGTKEGEYR